MDITTQDLKRVIITADVYFGRTGDEKIYSEVGKVVSDYFFTRNIGSGSAVANFLDKYEVYNK